MALQTQKLINKTGKIVRQVFIFILYLIFVYWATQAVFKYLDEPTTTKIYYEFGENGKQLKPSATTICSASKLPSHVELFKKECGLNASFITGKLYSIFDLSKRKVPFWANLFRTFSAFMSCFIWHQFPYRSI